MVALSCMGSAISSLVVAGNLAPRVLWDLATLYVNPTTATIPEYQDSNTLHRTMTITIIIFSVSPLCFLRSITPLRFAGAFSVFSVTFLVSMIVYMYLGQPSSGACQLYSSSSSSDGQLPASCAVDVVAIEQTDLLESLLQALPIFFFAYSVNFQVRSSFSWIINLNALLN